MTKYAIYLESAHYSDTDEGYYCSTYKFQGTAHGAVQREKTHPLVKLFSSKNRAIKSAEILIERLGAPKYRIEKIEVEE